MVKIKYLYTALIVSAIAYIPTVGWASNQVDTPHSASEGTGNFPQFDPSSYASQLFWFAIMFVLTYLVLSRVAMPKIAYVIDVRNSQKENDLSKAEQLNNEAEEALQKYEETIAKAHDKVREILHEAKEEILEQHNSKYEKFHEETQASLNKTEESIKKAISNAMADVALHATDLSQFTAEKLTLGKISNDDTKKIVASIWKSEGDI